MHHPGTGLDGVSKIHCKAIQIRIILFTVSVCHTFTVPMWTACLLLLLDVCKSLGGRLNPLGHGTLRDQRSLTRTRDTWTVACYIPETNVFFKSQPLVRSRDSSALQSAECSVDKSELRQGLSEIFT